VRFSSDPVGRNDLLIMLQGGNGCVNEYICGRTFNRQGLGTQADDYAGSPLETLAARRGELDADIFQDVEGNPFAGWSYAFLPYISGDNWGGDNDSEVTFYEPADENAVQEDGSVEPPAADAAKLARYRFHGRDNVRAIMRRLAPSFADVDRVVISGYSAGGIGVMLNIERMVQALTAVNPDVRIALLPDSGLIARDDDTSDGEPINGFPVCVQKRVRDLFRLDRGLPPTCTACSAPDGSFASALVQYSAEHYEDVPMAFIASPGDETMQGVLATGKVAADRTGAKVACGKLDYKPGLADINFYSIGRFGAVIQDLYEWARDVSDMPVSLLTVDPDAAHPGGKGSANHVWLMFPGLVLGIEQTNDDGTVTVHYPSGTCQGPACPPPGASGEPARATLAEFVQGLLDTM